MATNGINVYQLADSAENEPGTQYNKLNEEEIAISGNNNLKK